MKMDLFDEGVMSKVTEKIGPSGKWTSNIELILSSMIVTATARIENNGLATISGWYMAHFYRPNRAAFPPSKLLKLVWEDCLRHIEDYGESVNSLRGRSLFLKRLNAYKTYSITEGCEWPNKMDDNRYIHRVF